MKNLKLTEQLRDLVLLLTLAGVGYLTLQASESACAASDVTKREAIERRFDSARRGFQGPREGAVDFDAMREKRSGKKRRGQGGAAGSGANLPPQK